MPNRILKESICESRTLSEVSFFAEDLYKRLITYADDYGRFNADYQIILARLYPREIGIVSIDDIEDAMTELIGAGKVVFYTSDARHELYGSFPNWSDHQRIRDSKEKFPSPDDTTVNDWYLKRFISKDMKRRILERDGFKCQECGKYVFANVTSAERAIKFGAGLFHIDHIIPVNQGGRATDENLRLLCPACNLKRKRHFTIDEIIEMSQVAASRGESPQVAESCCRNPIQSESNPNPNTNAQKAQPRAHPLTDARFAVFWEAYPRKTDKQKALAAFRKLDPDQELLGAMLESLEKWKASEQWTEDGGRFIPHPTTWLNNKRWEDEVPETARSGTVVAQQYAQRDYHRTAAEEKANLSRVLDLMEHSMGGTG